MDVRDGPAVPVFRPFQEGSVISLILVSIDHILGLNHNGDVEFDVCWFLECGLGNIFRIGSSSNRTNFSKNSRSNKMRFNIYIK